jgi:hypothetical protein
MIEEWIQDAIHQSTYLRGKISNAYAQVEFLLGDLIMRCRDMDEYKSVPGGFPHGAPDRVKRVRILLKESGSLDPFRSELTTLMDRFSAKHTNRNLLAHGLCTVHWAHPKQFRMEFKKFHREKGADQKDFLLIKTFSIADLQEEAQAMNAVANDGLALFRHIHTHMDWSDP